MKVRIIQDFNFANKVLQPGVIFDVSNDFGAKMIVEGFAEEVKEVEVKRVPKVIKPEVKEEKKEKKGKVKDGNTNSTDGSINGDSDNNN